MVSQITKLFDHVFVRKGLSFDMSPLPLLHARKDKEILFLSCFRLPFSIRL